MTIYVDKIIVSFDLSDKSDCECEISNIRYCPNCQICRSRLMFKSLNKSKEYNTLLCRRCLNSMKGFKRNFFKKTFKKSFNLKLLYSLMSDVDDEVVKPIRRISSQKILEKLELIDQWIKIVMCIRIREMFMLIN